MFIGSKMLENIMSDIDPFWYFYTEGCVSKLVCWKSAEIKSKNVFVYFKIVSVCWISYCKGVFVIAILEIQTNSYCCYKTIDILITENSIL